MIDEAKSTIPENQFFDLFAAEKPLSPEILVEFIRRTRTQFIKHYKEQQTKLGFTDMEADLLGAEADTLTAIELQKLIGMQFHDAGELIQYLSTKQQKEIFSDQQYEKWRTIIETWNKNNPQFDFETSVGRRLLMAIVRMILDGGSIDAPCIFTQKHHRIVGEGSHERQMSKVRNIIKRFGPEEQIQETLQPKKVTDESSDLFTKLRKKISTLLAGTVEKEQQQNFPSPTQAEKSKEEEYSAAQIEELVHTLVEDWLEETILEDFHKTIVNNLVKARDIYVAKKEQEKQHKKFEEEKRELYQARANHRHRDIGLVETHMIGQALTLLKKDQRFSLVETGEYLPRTDILFALDGEIPTKVVSFYNFSKLNLPGSQFIGGFLIFFDDSETIRKAFGDNSLEKILDEPTADTEEPESE